MTTMKEDRPVLRARAHFSWLQPTATAVGSVTSPPAPMEFAVELYSNRTVTLDAPQPYAGLVTGLEWIDAKDAIKNDGGTGVLEAAGTTTRRSTCF